MAYVQPSTNIVLIKNYIVYSSVFFTGRTAAGSDSPAHSGSYLRHCAAADWNLCVQIDSVGGIWCACGSCDYVRCPGICKGLLPADSVFLTFGCSQRYVAADLAVLGGYGVVFRPGTD